MSRGFESREHVQELDPVDYGVENYDEHIVEDFFCDVENSLPKIAIEFKPYLDKLYKPDGKITKQSRNNAKMVQFFLVKEGYDLGKYGTGGVDGRPGKTTRRALMRYFEEKRQPDIYKAYRGKMLTQLHHVEAWMDTRKNLEVLATKIKPHTVAEIAEDPERVSIFQTLYKSYLDFQTNSKYPLGYIKENDIRALTYVETLFRNAPTNSSGSTGLMQLTSNPYRQMKKTPADFDMDFIKSRFEKFGYNFDTVHRSTSSRRKAYMDERLNSVIGIAYLQRCENISMPYKSWLARVTNHKAAAKRGLTGELKKLNVNYDMEKVDDLLMRLESDRVLQQKYMTYMRYNGDLSDRAGVGIEFRCIYALQVLYMGEHTF